MSVREEKSSIDHDEEKGSDGLEQPEVPVTLISGTASLAENIGLQEYIESKQLRLQVVCLPLTGCYVTTNVVQSSEANKKVRRKIDIHVLSIFFITSVLQFMDKTAINYANLFQLRQRLHLTGSEFSWLASLFYLGYLIGQLPASYFFAKFSTGRILGVCTVLWGVTVLVFAWTKNFAGAAACRFFLGVFEAPITPGITIGMGYWWTREEAPVRYTFVYSALGWAGIIGSLMSTGISRMSDDGSIARWQVVFVIVGHSPRKACRRH